MPSYWQLDTKEKVDNFIEHVSMRQLRGEKVRVEFVEAEGKPRTQTQSNCLHMYCGQLAEVLNDAGLDMKKVLNDEVDIPWTKQSVKDHLWRPIQEAMTGKTSTTEPTTVELSDVYLVLDRHISVKHGVSVPWPTRFGDGI